MSAEQDDVIEAIKLAKAEFVVVKRKYGFASHEKACQAVHSTFPQIVDALLPQTSIDPESVDPGSSASDHLRLDMGPLSIACTALERLVFVDVSYNVTRDGHHQAISAPIRLAASNAALATVIAGALAMYPKESL